MCQRKSTSALARVVVTAIALLLGELVISLPTSNPAAAAPVTPQLTIDRGTIATFAGSGGEGPALGLGLLPTAITSSGNQLYVADSANDVIRSIDLTTGAAVVVAGTNGTAKRVPGPTTLATETDLDDVVAVAVDEDGLLLYATDRGALVRVKADGTLQTLVAAGLAKVKGVAVSAAGIYYSTELHIDGPSSATIQHIRPDGTSETLEDITSYPAQPPAAEALAADDDGTLYFVRQNRVWTVISGEVPKVFAGTGASSQTGDGGPAIDATFSKVGHIAIDGDGLLIGEAYLSSGRRLRRVDAAKIISTVSGPESGNTADGFPVGSTGLGAVNALHVSSAGIRYIGGYGKVRSYGADEIVHTVVGNHTTTFGGDGHQATSALLSGPSDTLVLPDGSVAIADSGNQRIRKVAPDGTITTLYSFFAVNTLRSMALSPDGSIVFSMRDAVVRVEGAGSTTIIAGGGTQTGDGIPATTARLDPAGLAYGADGDLYITDVLHDRVRVVDETGIITTIAGNGTEGFTGDGGPATAASLANPSGVAVDGTGQVYIADSKNQRVRKIDGEGNISTVAGGGSPPSPSIGDGGVATAALLAQPWDVVMQGADVLVSDAGRYGQICIPLAGCFLLASPANHRVRRIDADGVITTVAGNSQEGSLAGDGGPPQSAGLSAPSGLGMDPSGTLYISDSGNNRVRVTRPKTVPAAPSAVQLTPGPGGSGHLTVSWTAPDDGGDPITRYDVVSQPGGQTCAWTSGPLSCELTGVALGVEQTITVTATNGLGPGPPSAGVKTTLPTLGQRYHSLTPTRLVDSRDGTGGFSTPWGGGESRVVKVTGGSVPPGATAVVLTMTAVAPSANTHVTVYPNGQTMPTASNLNAAAHQTVANTVIATVGTDGSVAVFNNAGTTDLVVDVSGYYEVGHEGGVFGAITPTRSYDSRAGAPFHAGETREVSVSSAEQQCCTMAYVVTVTVVNPSAATHLTVFPSGQSAPLASNLNAAAHQTVANTIIVGKGSAESILIRNNAGDADVVVDFVGYYRDAPAGAMYNALSPTRVTDSRDGTGGYDSPWPAGTTRDVDVTGGNVPDDAVAVVLTVTVVTPSDWTHVTVWPNGSAMPTISSVNAPKGAVVANTIIANVGVDGEVRVFNNAGSAHLVIDVTGYYK